MVAEARQLDAVRSQIREVRTQVLDVLVRIDDLILQQIPQARAEWQLRIGCWENALLEAEVAARRARRRLALMQAQVNRGEAVDESYVEARLDSEFASWQKQVDELHRAYEQAMKRISSYRPMHADDVRELGRAYHTLMKRLHPDVCRLKGERVASLFQSARLAYERGDLDALRSLEVATRHLETDDDLDGIDDLAQLEAELELCRIQESAVRGRLKEIESCEELRRAKLLSDPEWLRARTSELREAVRGWEAALAECRRREHELREAAHGR